MTHATQIPVEHTDAVNARILAVSEDRLEGFVRDPIGEIASRSGVDGDVVIERIRAMLGAGRIRRVRQTFLANKLADGALVAWRVPPGRLDAAFDFMFAEDPFSGHVVLRSTDAAAAGADFRLWTTVKVPQGYSLEKHCAWLASRTGAVGWRWMPPKAIFALGVGHVRRAALEPGSRTEGPAEVITTDPQPLSDEEWRILGELKREFAPEEIVGDLWRARARAAGASLDRFFEIAESFARRGLVGRFSTFLEHVKPSEAGVRVTRFNALFHWRVPTGRELEAGREVGRHHVLTHCYWREGGPDFSNVNLMGVAHGTDRDLLLRHKAAIDAHVAEAGIPVTYTNVFWGGRSEIKPSEILPQAYADWCRRVGLDPASMRE